MLGIRLSDDAERRLTRHARDAGRPKSVIARDWIMDRLEHEDVDERIRRAAKLHADHANDAERQVMISASDAISRYLDAEDGGYDWDPEGPPPVR